MMITKHGSSLGKLKGLTASLQLEKTTGKGQRLTKWLQFINRARGIFRGARPKASVVDDKGNLWIAKFPSRNDDLNIGAWEYIAHILARTCGIKSQSLEFRDSPACTIVF